MDNMCPISLTSVNERVVQLNAALVAALVLITLFTPHKWILVLLAIDFLIRGFLRPAYSYLSAVSKMIVRLGGIRPIMVDAGPKVFAAKIGFVFCCGMVLAELLGYPSVSVVIGGVLAGCAGLEAIFRFCVGCKLYPLIHRMKNASGG
jgi:hypothetical protein